LTALVLFFVQLLIYCLALIMIAFCYCSAKSDFASIVHQFVELNDAMGVPREGASLQISRIRTALKKEAKVHKEFFRTLNTHCASAHAKLQGAINAAKSAINDAKSNINNWTKNRTNAVKDQKDAAANIKKGRSQLVALRKRISKITMDYRVSATEADKKLNVVKVLRDIISDELFNKVPGALVQVSKFTEKLNELKNMLNNNSDSLYSPIISVLLDLATEQNFADQGVLRKILQNLNNLDKALRDFRAKQEKGLDAEMKSLRKQVKNVRQRIRAYRRMRPQAHSKALDAGHYIGYYTHEVQHFTAESKRMSAAKLLFTKLCAFQKLVHKKLKAASRRFVKIIVPRIHSHIQKMKTMRK